MYLLRTTIMNYKSKNSSFIHIITVIALLYGFANVGLASTKSDSGRPTNILVITVDDMNFDSVGAYGSTIAGLSPNIDSLARSGLRFEHAHVTVPVCAPSRAAWMTGRLPHRSGAIGFGRINTETPTLVEVLRSEGYLTGLLGKTRHTVASRANAWHFRIDRGLMDNGREPSRFELFARDFLAAYKRDNARPFFLMVNIHDPHRPFAGADQEEGYREQYRKLGWWHFPEVEKRYQSEDVTVPPPLPDLPDVREELAEYFTSVRRADETVGRLLRLLEEFKVADDTLVIFLSDHGMPMPYAKSTLYMYGTRAPWIMRWPGVIRSGEIESEHVASGIDLMPTILDAAGIDVPATVDGKTVLGVAKGQVAPSNEFAFTYFFETIKKKKYPSRAVTGRRYGYIYNAWPDGETEFILDDAQSGLTMPAMVMAAKTDAEMATRVQHYLYRSAEEFYDYEQDPGAHRNLVDQEDQAERVAGYRKALLKHLRDTGDPLASEYATYLKQK